MRPITVSQTGTGSTPAVPLDHYIAPFNVNMLVTVSGTVNYTVQHTFDDVLDPAVTPVWRPHASLASQTTTSEGSYLLPVMAIRLTVNSGSGTATLQLIEAGMPGRS